MRVVSVRGHIPNEWLAVPGNIYVGRRVFLRAGKKAAGQCWPQHELANPFHADGTQGPIEDYRHWLESSPERLVIVRALPADAVLGCWCVTDGIIETVGRERCHAEVIANVWRALSRESAKAGA